MITATLRPFRPADAAPAQALTASLGWPHRLEDWALMARLGTGMAAETDGALAGTALAWEYGGAHATIGMIVVSPAVQRQGLGRRLTRAVLDRLQGRTVVLHATDAGLPLYQALDFVADGAVLQYQGVLTNPPPARHLRPVTPADAASVIALDAAATGMDRGALLTAILQQATGVMLDHGARPAGFALLRPFGKGQLIGPVAAADLAAAQALIASLLAPLAGSFVRIDVPAASGLPEWLRQFGLADAGPAVRMVRGPPPARGAITTFALASQAFG